MHNINIHIIYQIIIIQTLFVFIIFIWIYYKRNTKDSEKLKENLELIKSILEAKDNSKKIVTLPEVQEKEKIARKIIIFSENIYRDIENDGALPENIKGIGSYVNVVRKNLEEGKEYQYFLKNDTHVRHIYKSFLTTYKNVLTKNNIPEFIFIPSNIFSFYSEITLYLIPSEDYLTVEGLIDYNIEFKNEQEEKNRIIEILEEEFSAEEELLKALKNIDIFISTGNKWIAKIKINKNKCSEKLKNITKNSIIKRFDCNSCNELEKERDKVFYCFECHYKIKDIYTGFFRSSKVKEENHTIIKNDPKVLDILSDDKKYSFNNIEKIEYGRYRFSTRGTIDKRMSFIYNKKDQSITKTNDCPYQEKRVTSIGWFEYVGYEYLPAVSKEEEDFLFYIELEKDQVNKLVLIRNNLLSVHKVESENKTKVLREDFINKKSFSKR